MISGIFLAMSFLRFHPLSNEEFMQYHLDEKLETPEMGFFPFPELFLVISFSLFLFIQYTLIF
jgi:hypothetical protein